MAAVGAGLCAALITPGAAVAAGNGDPYVYADSARTVKPVHDSSEAVELKAGRTYRSSIGTGTNGVAYYRVELDGAASAYASVVAVPPLGSGVKVSYADGIAVSLRDSGGNSCDTARATFRSGAYPRPIAAAAERLVRPGRLHCQTAGTYYVVVERKADAGSTRQAWGLELRVATESGLVTAAPTRGPEAWPSVSVPPPSGTGRPRSGGTGFNDAEALPAGVWQDRIRPGQSHFYRVPVDWGQQLRLGADLGSTAVDASRSGFVAGALDVELYNPARASVVAKEASYAGEPTAVTLDPLPPVAYENRFLQRDDESAMRLAGWYYVKVTLNPAMAQKYGDKASAVTLRVGVEGEAGKAPDYVRGPGEFQVTAEDREAAEEGEGGAVWSDEPGSDPGSGPGSGAGSGADAGPGSSAAPSSSSSSAASGSGSSASAGGASASSGSGAMTLLGVAGIGTGTALLLWLGAWRVVAVRRLRG
ncbi:hypothetical protein [Streptomyces sp. NPDC052225]|uniref:hypothetical protein n=1 Tax=Streptomyces sp. NPDC052225 TaxID=3154949 RepID=UPI003432977F